MRSPAVCGLVNVALSVECAVVPDANELDWTNVGPAPVSAASGAPLSLASFVATGASPPTSSVAASTPGADSGAPSRDPASGAAGRSGTRALQAGAAAAVVARNPTTKRARFIVSYFALNTAAAIAHESSAGAVFGVMAPADATTWSIPSSPSFV
jgi:hypothetical protein